MSNDPIGAVYEFYGENNQKLLKVYIFWGGFPDGAAAFLKVITDKMPDYLSQKSISNGDINEFIGNFVLTLQFLRIFEDSEYYEESEYIYRINLHSKQITTLVFDKEKPIWKEIETCSLTDFLKKHNELIGKK